MDVKKLCCLASLVFSLILSNITFAESVLKFQRTTSSGTTAPVYAYIKGNLVYLPQVNPSPKIDLIFNQSSDVFTVIDHTRQRYSQFTEADITRMVEQSQNAITAMQSLSQQLGQLSPGLQQSLGNMLPQNNASPQNYDYQWLQQYKKIAGYQCQTALVSTNDKAVASVCLATQGIKENLGADYAPLSKMLAIAKRLSNQSRNLASLFDVRIPQLGSELEGIPLEIFDGISNMKIQLAELSTNKDLSKLEIGVPVRYRKVSLMAMAAG